MREDNRNPNQLRKIQLTRGYTQRAEGSVLVEYGDTKVICTASVISGVPKFLKGKNQGWLTAEYGMLPRSTHERMIRESAKGKQSGRTQEIQRLIGRSLRAMIDLSVLGEYTITIDCDVIQADGGTRTASISGGAVALVDAVKYLQKEGKLKASPIKYLLGSVSVGIANGTPVLDLNYQEDSNAHTDMNVVMTENGEFIEVQGTAEGRPFSAEELEDMLALAKTGIEEIIQIQKGCLET